MSLSSIRYSTPDLAVVPNYLELEEDLDPILLDDSFIGATVPVRTKPDVVFVEPNEVSRFSDVSIPFSQQHDTDDLFGCQLAGAPLLDDSLACQRQSSGDSLNGWLESSDLSEFLTNLIGDNGQPPEQQHIGQEDEEEEKILEILNDLYRDTGQVEAEMSDRISPSSSYTSDVASPHSSWMEESPCSSTQFSPVPSPSFMSPKSKVRSRVEKKERKRLQNREAATRYRMKKKQEKDYVKDEMEVLLKRNRELKGQVEDVEYQIKLIKGLIAEVRTKRQAMAR